MQPNKLKINENEQIMHLFSVKYIQRSSEYRIYMGSAVAHF